MSLFISAFVVLGVAFLGGVTVLLIDIVPVFRVWLSRIHIGRQQDTSAWSQIIKKRGIKWLNRTPLMKVTDQTRLTVLDRMKGRYTSATLQDWQHAALLLGLAECENDANDVKEIHTFLNACFRADGKWVKNPIHIDSAIVAYSLFRLKTIEITDYRPALDEMYELIQDHVGPDGTVQYRKRMAEYRYVDTIGFICPFLISYGLKFMKPQAVDLAIHQIRAYVQHGMHGKEFIPCHAYDVRNHAPLGLYGWGRGLGWFAIGLIDCWDLLPQNHLYKSELQEYVARFARSVITFQQPNGNWNWTVTRPESRPDSSATAMLSWYLLKASAVQGLSDLCIAGVTKGITYLKSVTRKDGAIEFSQGDTKDIGHYSTLFGIMPFTQGFAIRVSQLVKVDRPKEMLYEDNRLYSNV
ncbi:glycoside hydrolase family 88 protein [Paenibacillus sp. LHD-117]|uniref:glycoside hydrolase family 88 protein n=1 Tax=Paenibacillus sp. LHD-117 TaxID=3071412 RepID=UPI0027E14B35|nr:glycoside hydrolase family 88 protein [Paenibacillus sp. LHD-117]MDQ6423258.1 glycoside hydrolase family 88 protein [Paenibacillus sp. LHD-117]